MPSGVYERKPGVRKGNKNPVWGKHWKIDETGRKNVSKALKGKPHPKMKGNHYPKMSEAGKGKHSGEKNHFWKGGLSFNPYPLDWTDILRESIRQRDNYVCKMCGIHQDELKGRNEKLDVHHIDYDKDNLDPDNLVSLCRGCHSKTNFDREYWTQYFKVGLNV